MKTRINRINFIKFGLFCLTILILFITKCNASQALEFTIEPSDRIVPEGSTVLLQCAGHTNNDKPLTKTKDGKLSPNIKWRGPDDADIGIDTFRSQTANGSLQIVNVSENRGLTGNYQCLLSVDGIGTIVSRRARLSIAVQPEVNQESNEMSLFVGQTVYFKCMSSQNIYENKNYRILWLKNNAPLRIDDTRMLILPSGALEIDEVTTQDRGVYQCNVSYESFHRVSSKTNLNIRAPSGNPESFAPPSFVVIPTTQTAREGDSVIFDCATNGNPKPKITWLRDGVDIDFNDLDSRFRMIGTGSLQISSVEDGDSGDYQCRSSNSVDSLDATATLNVQIPPKFIQKPIDIKASEKDELELPCSIRGKPKPQIQWLKNGDVIKPNDYMKFVNGHNLKILGLIENDSGMFQCVGINDAGSVQASAHLEVTPQGSGKKNQMSNKKKATKKILSTVATTKKPTKPDLKMMKSSYPNDSSQRSKQFSKQALDSLLSKNKNSSPQFASGQLHDSNDYLDRLNDNQAAEGGQSDDYSDYDDDEDEEGSIHPLNSGTDPNALLHALTNSKNINQNQNSNSHEISHFSNSHTHPVTRKNPLDDDSGNHPPVPLPGPPKAVQAVIVKPRFITINWLEPEENPDEVISYTVYYGMVGTDARERKISTNSRDEQEVNIQSLLPGKTYRIRVVGNSNHAQGRSSEILEITTQSEEGVIGAPENLQVAAISDQAIHLRWDPPKIMNGAIVKYRIFYTEGESGGELSAETTSTEFTLLELRSYCEYTVSVAAVNQNGMGNPTDEKLVKTYSNIPSDPPLNVSLEASSSTSIIIRWEPPTEESRNGPITGYKIKYRKAKKSGGLQTETTPGNVKFYELKNLDRMSSYQIKMAAMTVNGTGPFTEWNNIDTYENDLDESHVPGEPGWIRTKATADSIIVSWGPPVQQDIKVRGYILGWGNGIPDEFSHELDENARSYEIPGLLPNNEYVLSLRARNQVGDGPPKYDSARTRDEINTESSQPLEVPVGLRAIAMSHSSIVVYWTDTTLGKSQHVKDNRFYTIRYSTTGSQRYRYYNTTDLSCMITDLKPNTMYEFEVKVVKGRRESLWSMSVLNTTMTATPASPPRDLIVKMLDDKTPLSVFLTWLEPKHSNAPISNYVILYSTDSEKRERDWVSENVPADKTSVIINQLNPHTTYYFKVQTRHGKSLGPFSAMVSHTTGAAAVDSLKNMITSPNVNISTQMLLSLVGALVVATLIIVTTVLIICCRKKPQETPDHKKSYQKNPASVIKPPDLWIHHDHIEMKNVEKINIHQTTPGCSDGASSSGVMTLPRSVGHDFETETQFPSQITNSLDKRTYVPGYMTNSMSSSASDRPQYPRTQYNIQRSHMPIDPSSSQQNITNGSIIHSPENPYAYDVVPSNYSSNPNMAYPPGMTMEMAAKHRGHPLKSFSIPAPPSNTPMVAGGHNKPPVPSVTVIRASQNSSPYKKSTTTTPTNRLQSGPFVAHSNDEIQALRPSTSTEELNQEMANLEGLMKDLSAITASEFEC